MDNPHDTPIHSYTRAEAIADGLLVDVTEQASASRGFLGGFRIPVAVTSAVWADIEAIPKRCRSMQDERGRLHDVVYMASLAARRAPAGISRCAFGVLLDVRGQRRRTRLYHLHIGPGDDGLPVVTIMQPDED